MGSMSDLGFTALSSAWLLLLAVPLVLFYLLKLKRPRMRISSLVLWQRVLEDRRVNAPFQKFKRNILLLLQLLLLALIVLAAMGPFLQAGPERWERLPILIDCSASMAALDPVTRESRLTLAKQQVRDRIEGLAQDRALCLIAFGSTARRITDFTDNKQILRAALDSIQVEDVAGDPGDALRMAESLNRTAGFDEVVLISDGNLPAQTPFELPFRLVYQRLPPAGPNLGITALNAGRTAEDGWRVFARVEGSPAVRGTGQIRLYDGEEFVAEDLVSVIDGGSERWAVTVPGDRPVRLRVELTSDGFDSLAADNRAYLDLPALRPLSVRVAPTLPAYQHALRAIEGIRLAEADELADVIFTDEPGPIPDGAAVVFHNGVVPPDLEPVLTVADGSGGVVDWVRSAPVLRHVTLHDLLIAEVPRFHEGFGAGDLEWRGYEALVIGDEGPLLLSGERNDARTYHLLFHSERSTLPYRVAFPVLVANVVREARHRLGTEELEAPRTGTLPELTLEPDQDYRIQDPDGEITTVKADSNGRLTGVPAPRVGPYRVLLGEETTAVRGVSLASSAETGLAIVDELQFDELVVSAAAALPTERSLWQWLAAAALVILMGEWWWYQRQP
jgi:hypothetical protein